MAATQQSEDPELCRLRDHRDINRNPYTYFEPLVEGVDYGTRFRQREIGRVQVSSQYATGFPMSPDLLPSSGKAIFTLIAIDFPDSEGDPSLLQRAKEIAADTSAWFEKMSQGQFEIDWRFGDRVFRVASPSTSFGLEFHASTAHDLAAEIVAAADPYFDFSGVSLMWTLPPPDVAGIGMHFHNPIHPEGFEGSAHWTEGPVSQEGPVYGWGGPGRSANLNSGSWQLEHGPQIWSYYVHESLHSLGIADLYLGDNKIEGSIFDKNPTETLGPMDKWGIMSEGWHGSKTLISWHRFLLGWLHDDQVHCVPKDRLNTHEVTLVPIEREVPGVKSVMIPLSDRKLVVVESRRAEGYDSPIGEDVNFGVYDNQGKVRRKYLRDTGTSGVIVYTYDTSIHDFNGQAQMQQLEGRVPGPTWASCPASECTWWDPSKSLKSQGLEGNVLDPNDSNAILVPVAYDPLLRKGDGITVEGVTIQVIESGDYDRIRLSTQ